MNVPNRKGPISCSYLKIEIQPFTKCIFKTFHRQATLFPESLCAAVLLYKTILTESY